MRALGPVGREPPAAHLLPRDAPAGLISSPVFPESEPLPDGARPVPGGKDANLGRAWDGRRTARRRRDAPDRNYCGCLLNPSQEKQDDEDDQDDADDTDAAVTVAVAVAAEPAAESAEQEDDEDDDEDESERHGAVLSFQRDVRNSKAARTARATAVMVEPAAKTAAGHGKAPRLFRLESESLAHPVPSSPVAFRIAY
jgi:hypothetical protein